MAINKFNSKGYYDPVTYEALTNIERKEKAAKKADFKPADDFRPLVYICSPYAGNIKRNCRNARKYCRFAMEHNVIPIAPHLLFSQFMDDDNPTEREIALSMNMAVLRKCNELWVFGKRISAGMEVEINRAKCRNYRLRYFTEDCQEVYD